MNEKVLAPLASPFPASTRCQRAKSCMVLVSQSTRSIGRSWQNYTSFAVTCTHTLVQPIILQPIILCIPPNITELNPAKPLRATRLTSSYHVCLILFVFICVMLSTRPSIHACMHASQKRSWHAFETAFVKAEGASVPCSTFAAAGTQDMLRLRQ